jgi:hypothetical protein
MRFPNSPVAVLVVLTAETNAGEPQFYLFWIATTSNAALPLAEPTWARLSVAQSLHPPANQPSHPTSIVGKPRP